MELPKLINDQLSVWPEVAARFRSLKNVVSGNVRCNNLQVSLQLNPSRIKSTTAKIDKDTLQARPCFLCDEHRPKEQLGLPFEGRKGRKYVIAINPYPIFPNHLVIARDKHVPQSIWHHYVDMLDLASGLRDYTVFYNGPYSGASAPDHFHFQACPRGLMPLENAVNQSLDKVSDRTVPDNYASMIEYVSSVQDAELYHYKGFISGVFALKAKTSKSMAKLFYRLLDAAKIREGETEPRFNLFAYCDKGEYRSFVVFRNALRPHHYYVQGADHLTVSPGCADMAGVMVLPHKEDYDKMDQEMLSDIFSETGLSAQDEGEIIWRLTRTQPKIEVGILSSDVIEFEIISDGAGPQKVSYQEGKINYNGALYDELRFEARTMSTIFSEPTFIIHNVTIGVNFHWERKMTQKFAGTLKFIVEKCKVVAVNIIGVEDYLLSVISSEMKSSATLEFLKAHAVISRSWVMSQIRNRRKTVSVSNVAPCSASTVPSIVTFLDSKLHSGKVLDESDSKEVPEYIKWFDHDDHKLFDVCADDHCQRYQGLTMAVGETVRDAVDQTWGQVLTSGGEICDARFSKCCGGMMEKFSSCWEDKDFDYLQGIPDSESCPISDLTSEQAFRQWVMSSPKAFCNTDDNSILGQVLNDYDLETKDFFRWKVKYKADEVSTLINNASGKDFGKILALIPVERGVSGRLTKLKIIGSKFSEVIGKELIIRKFLSTSHLKSSAFVTDYYDETGCLIPVETVEKEAISYLSDPDCAVPKGFASISLTGAGWGHGVGLCQIGAAVMAFKGYDYKSILLHYYPGTELFRH